MAGEIVRFAVVISVEENAILQAVVTDELPSGVSFAGFAEGSPPGEVDGRILTWRFDRLDPGVHDLAYLVRVDDFAANGTVLTNRAALRHEQHPAVQEASASVTVRGDFEVRIGVYNGSGELVKEILVSRFTRPLDDVQVGDGDAVIDRVGDEVRLYFKGVLVAAWDGTTRDGRLAANGEYTIKLDNIDAFGVVQSLTRNVVVNRVDSLVSVTVFNSAGEAVRRLMTVVSGPRDLVTSVTLSSAVLHAGEGEPGPGEVREIGIVLSTGEGVSWDGRDDQGRFVPGGEYYVEVRTLDGRGGEQIVVRPIAVMAIPGGGKDIAASPNVLRGYSARAVFSTVPPSADRLDVKIYAVSGELVASKSGFSGQVVWVPGYDTANGLYIGVTEARDQEGRVKARRVLKFLIQR